MLRRQALWRLRMLSMRGGACHAYRGPGEVQHKPGVEPWGEGAWEALARLAATHPFVGVRPLEGVDPWVVGPPRVGARPSGEVHQAGAGLPSAEEAQAGWGSCLARAAQAGASPAWTGTEAAANRHCCPHPCPLHQISQVMPLESSASIFKAE